MDGSGITSNLCMTTGWNVYLQRLLDAGTCSYGYSADTMLKSEKGWMVMTRTYPRIPLWEETNESKPQWTRSGRLETYRVEPEAIEYGENFIVHREGPEATPYLPNAIMSSNPYIRPEGLWDSYYRAAS